MCMGHSLLSIWSSTQPWKAGEHFDFAQIIKILLIEVVIGILDEFHPLQCSQIEVIQRRFMAPEDERTCSCVPFACCTRKSKQKKKKNYFSRCAVFVAKHRYKKCPMQVIRIIVLLGVQFASSLRQASKHAACVCPLLCNSFFWLSCCSKEFLLND